VTADEINRAVIREAQRFPGQERQVFEFFQKNQQMRDNLRAPIYEDKTVDFVLELAKVSDRSVSAEDLMAAARAADEEDAKSQSAAA
jgi:trigger factor